MSGMDAIEAIHPELGIAVVQPGVTQLQLAEHLRDNDLPWMLNVTGSSSTPSVTGDSPRPRSAHARGSDPANRISCASRDRSYFFPFKRFPVRALWRIARDMDSTASLTTGSAI